MSTTTDLLYAIEQRAEGAIVRELRQMVYNFLTMRTPLDVNDRSLAEALQLKLNRSPDDHGCPPQGEQLELSTSPRAATDAASDEAKLSCFEHGCKYELRFFNRDYGELHDVVVAESFALAVQLARDRFAMGRDDRIEVAWGAGKGMLSIRTAKGAELLRIRPAIGLAPLVQPCVARACEALQAGEPALAEHLFRSLRRVA